MKGNALITALREELEGQRSLEQLSELQREKQERQDAGEDSASRGVKPSGLSI